MLPDERRESFLQLLQAALQTADMLMLRVFARNGFETLPRERIAFMKSLDLVPGWRSGEFLGADPHGRDRALEVVACIGERARSLHALEGGFDFLLAREIGKADDREADHRNEGKRGDTGADGNTIERAPEDRAEPRRQRAKLGKIHFHVSE